MFVSHRDAIEKRQIENPSVKGVTKQVLVGPQQGWATHVMRLFTLEPGGYAPRHSHAWPHTVYVVEGSGNLFMDGEDYPLKAGSTAYVPGDIEHQLLNTGEQQFVFICIVPEYGDT